MDMKRVIRGDALGMLCVGVAGLILAIMLNNDLLAAEIAIIAAFLINIVAISDGAPEKTKDRRRHFAASLLLGAFIGVVLA